MHNVKFENVRIKFLIYVSGLLLGLCAVSSTSAASFDCTKASSRIDNAICASPNLSQLDSDLGSAYRTAMSSSSDAAALKAVQIAWLKGTKNQCQDDDCLATVYTQRIAALTTQVQKSEVKVVTTNDPADQLYFADRTATLSATEVSEINKILSKLSKSGLVVAIHIFENTGIESISEVADRIGNNWIKRPDHARPQMVLALSKGDRKLRISVNNEMLSIFLDSETRSIIDEVMTPALKDGNTGRAILLALNRVDTTLTFSNASAVVQQGVPPSESASSTSSVTTTAKNLDINNDSNKRVIKKVNH